MHDRAFAVGCEHAQIDLLCADFRRLSHASAAAHSGGYVRGVLALLGCTASLVQQEDLQLSAEICIVAPLKKTRSCRDEGSPQTLMRTVARALMSAVLASG